MQNCRNNNPYMRRANCGCGNNNNSCNSNSCMANNDGRNPSMSHLFTENDLDVATGTMRWMECRSQWLMCLAELETHLSKLEKDSTEEAIFEELVFR